MELLILGLAIIAAALTGLAFHIERTGASADERAGSAIFVIVATVVFALDIAIILTWLVARA